MKPAALAVLKAGDVKNLIVASTPGGIEKQEADGQADQALQTTLPKKMNGCSKADFEKLGFKFLHETDKIFWQCIFPQGWSKRPKDHPMWSDLVDGKGRVRGSTFFKAAFYDYDAFISLDQRFSIKRVSLNVAGEEIFNRLTGNYAKDVKDQRLSLEFYEVRDASDIAQTSPLFKSDTFVNGNYNSSEAQRGRCVEWLEQNKPEWRSPAAYWD